MNCTKKLWQWLSAIVIMTMLGALLVPPSPASARPAPSAPTAALQASTIASGPVAPGNMAIASVGLSQPNSVVAGQQATITSTNLLNNGGFETGPSIPSAWFNVYYSGSTDITGWTITHGSVDHVDDGYWVAAEGTSSLDLNGYEAGGIAQTFAVTPGASYSVTFDLARNPGCGEASSPKTLLVKASGQGNTFTFDTGSTSHATMQWTNHTWRFTATSASTVLEFHSGTNGSYCGPALDNVSVQLTPPVGGPLSPGESFGGANPSSKWCACATPGHADPVTTATGNFWETFADISIPGRGQPLLFSRTYNSLAADVDGSLGYGWTHNYGMRLATDDAGKVTVHQENGSQVAFTPSDAGYTAPPRVIVTLTKNADGTFSFTRLNKEFFTFSTAGKLLERRDLNGYATKLAYNSAGQLTTVTEPAGRTLTLTYTNGRITSVSDQTGRKVLFGYDAAGNLTDVTDIGGGKMYFTYDANHRMLTKKDPRGGVVTNHYDAEGRVDWQTDQLGRKFTFAYTPTSTTITDPKGNVTFEEYAYGLRTAVTHGHGTAQAATWRFEYDPATIGMTSITDPRGAVTTKAYDARGNVLSVTDPLGRTTTYTYNARNDVTSVTDPKGVKTTLAYDTRGNVISESRPLLSATGSLLATRKTSYAHANATYPGDVTSMTDPLGKVWTFTYDAYGNKTSDKDPLGNRTTYAYDTVGRMTSTVAPKGNLSGANPALYRTTYAYNTRGQVTSTTDPLLRKTSFGYDAEGNLISLTDPKGNITRSTYNLADELTVTTRPDLTTVKTTYNADGTVWQQIDGRGRATTYGYDSLGRVSTATDPLGRVTRYGYDLAGNLATLTDPQGQVTTHTYDAASQLKSVLYSSAATPDVTAIGYDNNGNRTSMADGTGTSTWAYDSLGRLLSHKNGAGSVSGYGYDLKGQITSITYPGGLKVTRLYDAAGRMTKVTDWKARSSTFTYDQHANLRTQTVPSVPAVRDTFAYSRTDDLLGTTSTRLSSTPVRLASFGYTRDAADMLASAAVTLNAVAQPKETYGYDKRSQLTTINTAALYGYDAADNMTKMPGATLAYDVANQLTSLTQGTSVTKFSYDSRGNRTSRTLPTGTVTKYGYDQASRLTSYGTTATYKYNGDGLRTSKTVSGVAKPFVWDVAQGLPLLLKEGTTSYIYGPGGMVLAQVSSTGVPLYYHRDQLGSIRMLTDGAGAVKATYNYDAYGKLKSKTGTVANPFVFAGEYTDAESGMQYLRARYYDPATGQFISRDPIVAKTRSAYGYADNNPTNFTDPTGLTWESPFNSLIFTDTGTWLSATWDTAKKSVLGSSDPQENNDEDLKNRCADVLGKIGGRVFNGFQTLAWKLNTFIVFRQDEMMESNGRAFHNATDGNPWTK